ncbi:hypothetical protein J6590_036155 [Homalodisca vitripennis]|nr:hypothetical protein J6590_036155 [Homalodisca vitripennis]
MKDCGTLPNRTQSGTSANFNLSAPNSTICMSHRCLLGLKPQSCYHTLVRIGITTSLDGVRAAATTTQRSEVRPSLEHVQVRV